MSPKRPPAALRILPIVRLLAAIRALPETVSNPIALAPELIRGSPNPALPTPSRFIHGWLSPTDSDRNTGLILKYLVNQLPVYVGWLVLCHFHIRFGDLR